MNYQIFIKFDYYQKFTFGRFFEIIPFCISGYIIKVHIKSICFFIIFTLFTSEKIKNKNIINLILLSLT